MGVKFNALDELPFAEMKARRDILEHNNGQISATYREKAKAAAKYNVGDFVQLVDDDVDAAYTLVLALIRKIAAEAIAKSKSP